MYIEQHIIGMAKHIVLGGGGGSLFSLMFVRTLAAFLCIVIQHEETKTVREYNAIAEGFY